MTSIQLTLTGAQARAEVDGLLTAGMVGVPVTIVWDESWNGLVKNLVCRSDGCIRTILNVGSHATVASEVFRTEKWTPNTLYLGVEGRDAEGKLVIPSTFAYCGQILPGAVADGTVSQEPENPAWAQILGIIGDMGTLATAQKNSLVEAINEAAGLSPAQGAASVSASYQLSSSHDQIPTGAWGTSIPALAAGKFLWTKITLIRSDGTSDSLYSVSGGVTSVNGIQPDSTGNVALTATQAGAVPLTGGTMTGPLNMVSPTAETHGANKAYVDSAVSKAAPANLLDNSDFRNPVNQRGQTEYTGTYAIDRWRGWESTKVSITSNGIKAADGRLFQYLMPSACRDVTHTLAVKCTDGTTLISVANPHSNFQWFDNGCGLGMDTNITVALPEGEFEWAALYEGEYTADTLPEYRPKGYGAELAECQRYFIKYINSINNTGFGCTLNSGVAAAISVITPVPMRITPTVMVTELGYLRGNGITKKVEALSVSKMFGNIVQLNAEVESIDTGLAVNLINCAYTLTADL